MTKKLLKLLHLETDYVKLEDGEYILKSKYKIGKIKLLRDIAQLELLDRQTQKIFIDFSKLNGALMMI